MIEPGIHKMSFSDYKAMPYLNATTIINFLGQEDRAHLDKNETKDMEFGHKGHNYFLERHLHKPSKVSSKDIDLLEAMEESLKSGKYETARLAIESSQREQTIVWDHIKHGIRCKARLDLVNAELGYIADLKFTKADINPEKWLNNAMRYTKPFVQPYFYLRAANTAYLDVNFHTFFWILFSKVEPYSISEIYATRTVDGTDPVFAWGRIVENCIPDYMECKRKDEWAGVEDRIKPCNPSSWFWRETAGNKYYG